VSVPDPVEPELGFGSRQSVSVPRVTQKSRSVFGVRPDHVRVIVGTHGRSCPQKYFIGSTVASHLQRPCATVTLIVSIPPQLPPLVVPDPATPMHPGQPLDRGGRTQKGSRPKRS